MNRIHLLTGIALAGLAIAAIVVVDNNRTSPVRTPAVASVTAPFASYVAGTGITETGRGNVSIGSAVPGVVREVNVRVGDRVNAGDPLFMIDDRDLQARLLVARADTGQAEAALEKPRHRLGYLTRLQHLDRAAISVETLTNARDDVNTATAATAFANAVAAQLQVEIARLVVRAPTAGRILQVNTRAGEFVNSSVATKPLMLLGDDTRLYLRVDIDENDAWRIRPDAQARAFVRGNPLLAIPLRFEYIEPYVTPKTSLTGQSTERTDLRVLQVVYSFEHDNLPVYLGQQMDAFIQAPAAGTDARDRQR
ncbi:MAG: efflux RND transporter periplasmic adaptor subunit [Luteimonas sp.]